MVYEFTNTKASTIKPHGSGGVVNSFACGLVAGCCVLTGRSCRWPAAADRSGDRTATESVRTEFDQPTDCEFARGSPGSGGCHAGSGAIAGASRSDCAGAAEQSRHRAIPSGCADSGIQSVFASRLLRLHLGSEHWLPQLNQPNIL